MKALKERKTFLGYSLALRELRETCSKSRIQDIDRKDLLRFIAHLKSKGHSPRTVANRVRDVKVFFLNLGASWPLLKSDKPRFTEKLVAAYNLDDIRVLLATASQEDYELFHFFLCTGCREKEVQFATWADVNFSKNLFAVKE